MPVDRGFQAETTAMVTTRRAQEADEADEVGEEEEEEEGSSKQRMNGLRTSRYLLYTVDDSR